MQKIIFWTSQAYHSLEKCIFKLTKDGAEVSSVIIDFYNNITYQVEYSIQINKNWETVFFEINSNLNGLVQSFSLKRYDHGDTVEADKSLGVFADA